MRKFLIPGILAGLLLFLPHRSQAVPLDVPYQILIDTTNNSGTLVVSTANFPSLVPSVNASVGNYQWCVDRLTISCATAANFSIFWATSTISAGTTDYMVTVASAIPYDADLGYREPYCAPVGQSVVTFKSSVAASTITLEGFLWKGWNP